MTKVMLSIAVTCLMGMTFTSRAGSNNLISENITEETSAQDSTKSKDGTPVFSAPEANKAVAYFKVIMDKYGPYLVKNDTAKTVEFGTKIQEWSSGAQTWMTKLTPDEQQKLNTYLQDYSKKYMPAQPAAPTNNTGH